MHSKSIWNVEKKHGFEEPAYYFEKNCGPSEIIKIPKLGVIGSHPTELPKYRGRAPIPWTIIKNLKESALTFFYIDEGIDDGDILDQINKTINVNESFIKFKTPLATKLLTKDIS